MSAGTITFDEFEIDPARGELRRAGSPVAVEPQVLDLIAYLAANPGRVLSRDDLIQSVWGGRIVSDSAIATRINAARTALGDNGTAQRFIKTIPRRGYRFEAVPRPAAAVRSLPDKPSIAVLPFQNMSGDPGQAYFSDGITDDIITGLSRYAELFVIARHSSFAHRDSSLSPAEIAADLGVQYLAEGSVRRAGDRIRVTVRLVDAEAGQELWAERYDRELTDIFKLQDDIARIIVNRLAGQIARQRHKRALAAGPGAVSAYDHVLRAQALIFGVGREDARKAHEELKKALEIEPENARAHAMISWYYITEGGNGWGMDPKDAFDAARAAARMAITLDDQEPFAPVVLGWAYLWRDRQFDRALAELGRACALNPGNAAFRSYLAFAQIYSGEHRAGKAGIEAAMQLNPHFPVLYDNHYMRALFHLGESEAALPHAARVCMQMPQASNALSLAAAIYASLGMQVEAAEVVRMIGRVSPEFTLSYARDVLPYRRAEDRDQYLAMLERAGLPQ